MSDESKITGAQIWEMLARNYADRPGEERLSIGHYVDNEPYLPRFYAFVSVTMDQVREWAEEGK